MSALTPDETILGLLAARPQHGYQLLDIFNDPLHLGNVWKLSTSQLYAVLKRLEQRGWIVGAARASANAPTRTEYAITEAGRAALNAWLEDPAPSASVRRVRVEFLSRLYVAQALGLAPELLIGRQRAACLAERAWHADVAARLPDGVGGLAAALVSAQLDALLAWLDHCEIVLSSKSPGDTP